MGNTSEPSPSYQDLQSRLDAALAGQRQSASVLTVEGAKGAACDGTDVHIEKPIDIMCEKQEQDVWQTGITKQVSKRDTSTQNISNIQLFVQQNLPGQQLLCQNSLLPQEPKKRDRAKGKVARVISKTKKLAGQILVFAVWDVPSYIFYSFPAASVKWLRQHHQHMPGWVCEGIQDILGVVWKIIKAPGKVLGLVLIAVLVLCCKDSFIP